MVRFEEAPSPSRHQEGSQLYWDSVPNVCPRVVSPLPRKTTDRCSMISVNKHLIVPSACSQPLCSTESFSVKYTSAWSRKREGRKGERKKKVRGGWAKLVLFLLLFLNKANFGTEIW